jgi:hypothetical protein
LTSEHEDNMEEVVDYLSAVDEESDRPRDDDKSLLSGSVSERSSIFPTGESKGTSSDEQDIRNRIIKEEERNVRGARILVGIAFLACAVSVSVAVYFFAKESDTRSFEVQVSISSDKSK